ncbi:uncharacterized protein BT62DRAFT_737110 [Guyanagaster necrorhizus]|uniref:Uncharacterized protein n=1 Tax=Guyanagaster necrorhizus TaxID=856835 RepID=A0A9P7VEW1_9AGAR|nr:uncharacterized protein BT62DRAFT_737110 [Guyanagaster necrorhizus MCA 3950]KAG7439434.1 hypothetical protein BT62DRAFT_737110 [Guyanagaster necrorhizus MCA 3950]
MRITKLKDLQVTVLRKHIVSFLRDISAYDSIAGDEEWTSRSRSYLRPSTSMECPLNPWCDSFPEHADVDNTLLRYRVQPRYTSALRRITEINKRGTFPSRHTLAERASSLHLPEARSVHGFFPTPQNCHITNLFDGHTNFGASRLLGKPFRTPLQKHLPSKSGLLQSVNPTARISFLK